MPSGQSPRRLVYISNVEETAPDRALLNPLRLLDPSRIKVTGTALCFPREADAIRQAADMRDSADAIILGGGVFGNAILDDYIEFWREARVPLILWGAGLSERASSNSAALPQLEDYYQLAGFTLIGLRDYGLGFRWVPCSSCMNPLLNPNSDRGSGSVLALRHTSRAMPEFGNAIKKGDPLIPVVYDDAPFDVLIATLRQAEFVITNSYAAAYWSTLLGKRVIAIEDAGAMTMSKHPPVVADKLDWPSSLRQSLSYPHALEECRQATVDYRDEVAKLVSRPGSLKPYNRDPVAEHAKDTPAPPPILTPSQNLAPRIVHFIFGLAADFGGKPFNVMHQIAILSAIDQIKPEQVFFYYRHLPSGALFDSITNLMTLIALPPATGQAPAHFAHQSDVIRLQTLHEWGGIYLDLDTISVASFDPLLAYPFTIGVQGLSRIDGLCNAVMIAKPRSAFVRNWLDAYSRFTDQWDRFSVRLPYVMWRSGRWDVHVEPFDSFHWPTWRAGGLSALFERDFVFPNARCHHLWESQSYPRYFSGKTDEQIVTEMRKGDSTYSRLARRYVSRESA